MLAKVALAAARQGKIYPCVRFEGRKCSSSTNQESTSPQCPVALVPVFSRTDALLLIQSMHVASPGDSAQSAIGTKAWNPVLQLLLQNTQLSFVGRDSQLCRDRDSETVCSSLDL